MKRPAPAPDRAATAATPGELGRLVVREERVLLLTVGAWGLASVLAGAALWRSGRARPGTLLVGIGRQAAIWGAVDLAVAGFGARRSPAAPETDADARRRSARMAAITGANAVADVAYLAGAVAALRRPARRADGAGALAQAAFLLVVDARHARRFAALWRGRRSTPRLSRP
jgi:hypothetical protein